MEIETIEMGEKKARFVIRDTSPAMANALRRALVNKVPKMAIDTVEFHLGSMRDEEGKEYESKTPLFDEIIAHRLGLLPVPTDLSLYTYKDKCVCGGEGCPNCTIIYSLVKSGPCTVLSSDMVPLGDPNLAICDPDIPILELGDGQSVMIYAHAVLGTAENHAKWQAASGVGYKYMPVITVKSSKRAQEIADSCPRGVFTVSASGDLGVEKPLDCMLCDSCVEVDGGESVEVVGDETSFVFSFETDGSLSAETMILKACEVISEGAKAFSESVDAL
ncbi:MAG: DNA-directed RNA polymerase subunit D [Thermoplasmatales archaeon]|nr:DNA-directed RNA polymerase subunit D [Thermoplasmatales archaeon]